MTRVKQSEKLRPCGLCFACSDFSWRGILCTLSNQLALLYKGLREKHALVVMTYLAAVELGRLAHPHCVREIASPIVETKESALQCASRVEDPQRLTDFLSDVGEPSWSP